MTEDKDISYLKKIEQESLNRIIQRIYITYSKRNTKQTIILNFDDYRLFEDKAGRPNHNIEFQATIIKYTDKDNKTYQKNNCILIAPLKSFVNAFSMINLNISEIKGRKVIEFNVQTERCYNILRLIDLKDYKN